MAELGEADAEALEKIARLAELRAANRKMYEIGDASFGTQVAHALDLIRQGDPTGHNILDDYLARALMVARALEPADDQPSSSNLRRVS